MKKIEAIIQPYKLDDVKAALKRIGVDGITIYEVRSHDHRGDQTEIYRGQEYMVDLPRKMKLELVAPDSLIDEIVNVVSEAAQSGKVSGKNGDGKIFVSSIDDAICIQYGGHGDGAL